MKVSESVLRDYVDLPATTGPTSRDVRDLLDDLGLEVKRVDASSEDLGNVYTLELLANRGDHHCYAGVAREISGRTGDLVRLPDVAGLDVGETPREVRIESPLCLRYSITQLARSKPYGKMLSDQDLRPLVATGQGTVSVPVDATNLANLELGQPTHAFDADTVKGAIVLRTSRAGEKAWPLFQPEPIALPEGLLVVADEEKILAIAGVIGCEESKTTDDTIRVLLESACFDPVAVRKASRAIGIQTDSSARFERGSDPAAVLAGAGRVVHLMERHGWKREGETGLFGAWEDPERVLALDVPETARFLDVRMDADEAQSRLERYGFVVVERQGDVLQVKVPPHRLWDVEFAADLHEELAKSLGYNATPVGLPPVDMGKQPSRAEDARRAVDDVLVAAGFFEVFTDGFYGRDLRDKLGIGETHPLWRHVETQNALDRGYSLLKNNAFAQAVDAVATNLRLQTREIKAFEWTRTFHPDASAANGVCSERRLLWLVASGPRRHPTWQDREPLPADVPWLEGLVADVAGELGIPLEIGAPDPAQPLASLLHPGRQATIRQGGQVVGILGEVHPSVCAAFKIKRERPVYLEISESALHATPAPRRFAEPPELLPVERNLAFTLPIGVPAGDVVAALRAGGPDYLDRVDVVDLYEHEEAGRPVRTLTFALRFAPDRPLTSEALNAASDALVAAVAGRLGDRGVKLRGV